MKRIIAVLLTVLMIATVMTACSGNTGSDPKTTKKSFKVGICNYVDHASLNQIVDNVKSGLSKLGKENDVEFEILSENCNADADIMNQIIANFVAEDVDLMIGVATPVAMAMQSATEDNEIPVVFAAVSDPVGVKLVSDMEAPGANITGTSDYLNTNSIMELIFAANPEASTVGLLYDIGQDASTGAIADAKAYLDKKGVKYIEQNGTTAEEVKMAAQSLADDKVDAVFTPTDNTIMEAELSIYEIFSKANIPHYGGADSFALNGAFLGYGVDYTVLGTETANMTYSILVDGSDPAKTAVKTFDNGIATVNTDTCAAIGYDLETIKKAFAPYSTKVEEIKTAESFD